VNLLLGVRTLVLLMLRTCATALATRLDATVRLNIGPCSDQTTSSYHKGISGSSSWRRGAPVGKQDSRVG
jgi:hypothetical protein